MNKPYEEEFKKKIVQLHLEAGRSISSLAREYNVCHSSISIWCRQFREEFKLNNAEQNEYEQMKKILNLNNRIAELEKENLILKKMAKILVMDSDI